MERGPEKAGVGGSIPSLATTVSLTPDAGGVSALRLAPERVACRDSLTGRIRRQGTRRTGVQIEGGGGLSISTPT